VKIVLGDSILIKFSGRISIFCVIDYWRRHYVRR